MIKMCICHRDINSRNILVKADLSCCIADFGFGTKLNGSRYERDGEMILAETKSIYEVGTMRYMAPEILEGAVNLRDCETSLKQIDVYSEGLVLWELAMRCFDFYPPEMGTPPYKAPYEAEIGSHPSFDQMRALVLQHKARPLFPPQWGGGSAAHAIREICEDCWDPDAEARLTSLCVEERLIEISTMKPRSHYVTMSTSLSTNNNIITSANINSINTSSSAIPPNQTATRASALTCDAYLSSPSNDYTSSNYMLQKNREMYGQQIQQFQGRNLCLERNLVQIHQADQSNDEKSIKKGPLSNGNQLIHNVNVGSYYDGEYEVLVEELLTKKLATSTASLQMPSSSSQTQPQAREVLQKKNNSEKKSSRWRDIVHAKFQPSKRRNQSLEVDDVQQSFSSPVRKQVNGDVEVKIKNNNAQRPNNLDIIAPITVNAPMFDEIQSYKTPLNDPNSDPFAIIPPTKIVTSKSATLNSTSDDSTESNQLKRQRSLEVFREVFAPSKLRDIQCRVKTPGDLPPSVRKVRASKTLSLYDDRIMDPNDKFIRDNNSL
jgi:bone morphogenetic protein receptor type-2